MIILDKKPLKSEKKIRKKDRKLETRDTEAKNLSIQKRVGKKKLGILCGRLKSLFYQGSEGKPKYDRDRERKLT